MPRAHGVAAHSLVRLVVSHRADAASQCEQGSVDVVRLLHPLSILLVFTALRASQVTHTQPETHTHRHSSVRKSGQSFLSE